MSKAVLISIKPEWCAKIAFGEKTIEVRKTRPKLKTPFKCYIYCTTNELLTKSHYNGEIYVASNKLCKERLEKNGNLTLSGKIIGEFVCDKIFDIYEFSGSRFWLNEALLKDTCLSYDEIKKYAGNAKEIYGWHISDVKIYDAPKELSEFLKYGYDDALTDWEDLHCIGVKGIDCVEYPTMPKEEDYRITRAPQSWCYVEELT